MFRIDDTTKLIELNRGDSASIKLSIDDYIFKEGDTIKLNIYNANRMNRDAVFTKTYNVTEEMESINMSLLSEETKFGKMKSKPIDYWYEIEFNKSQTIIGYDEDGAKIFRLYPEGYNLESEVQ